MARGKRQVRAAGFSIGGARGTARSVGPRDGSFDSPEGPSAEHPIGAAATAVVEERRLGPEPTDRGRNETSRGGTSRASSLPDSEGRERKRGSLSPQAALATGLATTSAFVEGDRLQAGLMYAAATADEDERELGLRVIFSHLEKKNGGRMNPLQFEAAINRIVNDHRRPWRKQYNNDRTAKTVTQFMARSGQALDDDGYLVPLSQVADDEELITNIAARAHGGMAQWLSAMKRDVADVHLKRTTDREWIKAHGGSDQVDVIETEFHDLPEDLQRESRDVVKQVFAAIADTPADEKAAIAWWSSDVIKEMGRSRLQDVPADGTHEHDAERREFAQRQHFVDQLTLEGFLEEMGGRMKHTVF